MPDRILEATFKAALGSLMLVGVSLAVVGLASEHYAPLRDSPTSTALSDNAPLAEEYLEAFVGESGVYDPARGVVTPEETHFEIELKAAFNDENLFLWTAFPTPLPAYYHDYWVYQDGEWLRAGRSPVGPEPHGAYEDRITMLVDDGSVKGFANQGGWITCHDDLRDPFMYNAAPGDVVGQHPVLADHYGLGDVRKYIPQSRDVGPEWWEFGGWDAMSLENVERYDQRHDSGVFLDLWHWRSHRSNPIQYSDNQYVFEHRRSSPGTGPYTTNWDSDAGHPAYMYDADVTGFAALDWDTVQAMGYSYEDAFFLADEINAAPFDPDHQWQDGDVIPRRMLRTPDGSRGIIEADGRLIAPDQAGDDWSWEVTQWRPLDTGYDQADKQFRVGRTYNAAVAIHRLATGSRWHFVSFPFTIGIDTPGDVTASRFTGDRPDWDDIEGTTMTVIYPGQTSWQWLMSEEHPGGEQMRNDSMSVVGCHDEIGLGASNKEIESYLAGVGAYPAAELAVARPGFDPTNVVFWFVLLALLLLVFAVILGRIRRS